MLLYGLEYTVLFLLRRGTDTISRFALPFYIERCDKFLIGLHIGIHPRNWKRYLVNIYKDFFSREQPLVKNFSRVSKTASPFQLNSHVSGACVRSTSTCSRIRYRFSSQLAFAVLVVAGSWSSPVFERTGRRHLHAFTFLKSIELFWVAIYDTCGDAEFRIRLPISSPFLEKVKI